MSQLYKIVLAWKNFSVSLSAVDAKLKTQFPNNYVGNQAHAHLELYFQNDIRAGSAAAESCPVLDASGNPVLLNGVAQTQELPSDSALAWVLTYWNDLMPSSAEATGYQTQAQIAAAAATAKASGLAKLKALGLSDAEIAAIVG